MAKLTVFSGAAHTQKSTQLYERLCAHMANGEHAVLLVPEQATFAAEQRLTAMAGGLLGVEVYSFERLTERILESCGDPLPYLSQQGQQMVVRRAAIRKQKELLLFGDLLHSQGFSASMEEWIAKLKQSCISPDQLDDAVQRMPDDTLLKQKLHDLAVLYRESEEFLNRRYLTADDMLQAVLDLLDDSWIRDCHIYIDDPEHPKEQLYRLLYRLIRLAPSVTLTLRMEDGDPTLSKLFSPDAEIFRRLQAFAAEQGIPFFHRHLTERNEPCDPALLHLRDRLFSPIPERFASETDAITVTAAADRSVEVDAVADAIFSAVRHGDVRYRDIVVATSQVAAYAPLVRRAFARRGIPLYSDAARPIFGHAAATFLLSAVRFAASGHSANDLLLLVKSGYTDVSESDAERLENYILRYGLYGSELLHPLDRGEIPDGLESVRAELVSPLLRLREALRSKTTEEKVRGIYAYFTELRFAERLKELADALLAEGEKQEAQIYAQVWGTFDTLFSQMVAVMGDTPLSHKEFTALLEEGLSGFPIGTVPGTGDHVLFGDLLRMKPSRMKRLFILGCNEGAFLPPHSDDSLINDRELSELKQNGLPVWNGTEQAQANDRLKLYSLLGRVTERVGFSYAFSAGGQEQVISVLLTTVLKMFPHVQTQVRMSALQTLPSTEATAFSEYADLLRVYKQDGTIHPSLPMLHTYFSEHPSYRDTARDLMHATYTGGTDGPFGKELAAMLYGTAPSMSPSRLELYARCPFAQYLRYGLRLEERKEAQEKAADAGTFLHDVLDAFVKELIAQGTDLRSMEDSDARAILDRILPPLIAQHNDGIFLNDPRLRESLFLRIELAEQCCMSILQQLNSGTFAVEKTEMSFGMADADSAVPLTLTDGTVVTVYGKIDRIDRTRDGTMYRIIDYKLGKARTFDAKKFYSGESLQLPLYLKAAEQLGGRGVGMYYMPLNLGPAEEDKPNQHRLSGITVLEDSVLQATEADFSTRSELLQGVKRTKSGELTGPVCSQKRMEGLVNEALAIASRHAEAILGGEAKLLPTGNACKYCPYGSVCRFDEQLGCRQRFVPDVSMDTLLTDREVN